MLRTLIIAIVLTLTGCGTALAQNDRGFFERVADAAINNADFQVEVTYDNDEMEVEVGGETADGRVRARGRRAWGYSASITPKLNDFVPCDSLDIYVDDEFHATVSPNVRGEEREKATKRFGKFTPGERVGVYLVCLSSEPRLNGVESEVRYARLESRENTTVEFRAGDFPDFPRLR